MKRVLLVALLLAMPVAAKAAGDGAELFSGELTVVLKDALFRGATAGEDPAHLILELAAERGTWDTAWGMALNYNDAVHYGLVRSGQVGDRAVTLDVEMRIDRDERTRGGRAEYRITLTRDGAGGFTGRYEGTYKGQPVSGEATAAVRPPRPAKVEGYEPVRPGEHPRMLLRRSDLPALRQKLQTPLGKAYLEAAEASGDLISLGMLYQLTGDRAYAERALKTIQGFGPPSPYPPAMPAGPGREIAKGYLGDIDPHPSGSGSTGHRLVEVAFTYDLCYDAWPDEFRRQLAERMLGVIEYRQMRLHPGHANYHPCSNYYGPSHGSTGMAALAIWGEPGPEPVAPLVPFNAASESASIEPDADYTPGSGVPVTAFASDAMPPEWVHVGGYSVTGDEDPLRGLGGPGKARPKVGDKVSHGGRSEAFRLLSHEADKGYYQGMIDITNACGRAYFTTSYFYTVIDNDRPRWAVLLTDYEPAEVYLAGTRLAHGDVVHLRKGLYPVLVVAPIGQVAPWGRDLVRPRLLEVAADDASRRIGHTRALYRLEHDLWQRAHDAWEATGIDPTKQHFVGVARQRMLWHYRLGIGDGGFQAETGAYARIGSWYPLVYAAAYRTMFGRDASPHPDVTHLVPRRMMQVLFHREGGTSVQKINSDCGFDPWWCAAGFPIAPGEYRPGLLWAWNHVRGIKGAATQARAIRTPEEKDGPSGLNMAHSFINYPTDLQPVHPSESMPLVWQAPTFGYYCFRSGWQGDDEFIAQVFLKASNVRGWNHGNAGTFRLYGLGQGWNVTPESRNGVRAQEPIVYLPDDEHNEGACARLTYLETAEDGSASMAIDLGDVYSRPSRELYDKNLIRLPEGFVESGISGMRAIAFDYSGASGAPCLMVLVDRVDGGGRKEWYWPLRTPGEKNAPAYEATVDEGGFTIARGDATMHATFIAPARPTITVGLEQIQVRDPRHGYHGPVDRVKAVGADPTEGAFFVVATFQRGDAPPVKVTGKGLGAKVTVGGQTVRFEGGRIVLGP